MKKVIFMAFATVFCLFSFQSCDDHIDENLNLTTVSIDFGLMEKSEGNIHEVSIISTLPLIIESDVVAVVEAINIEDDQTYEVLVEKRLDYSKSFPCTQISVTAYAFDGDCFTPGTLTINADCSSYWEPAPPAVQFVNRSCGYQNIAQNEKQHVNYDDIDFIASTSL